MADEDRESVRDRQSSIPTAVYAVIALLAIVVVALLITRPATDSTDIADPTTEATEVSAEPVTEALQVERADFILEKPAGWSVLSEVEMVKFQDYFAYAARRSNPDALVSVRVQESDTRDVDMDELADSLDMAMAEKFTGFEKVSEETIKLNGDDALRYEYTFTSERDEKVREQIIIVLAGDTVFHIASWANDKDFENVSGEIDSIVQSFAVK